MLLVPAVVAFAASRTLVGSLLVMVIFKFPAGAGAARLPPVAASTSLPTVVPFRVMAGAGFTVMAALAGCAPVAVACKLVFPTATPVTVTVAELAPAAKVTVAGTVALVVSSMLRLAVKPPLGAGAERFRMILAVL
jgi:hypothetical protein